MAFKCLVERNRENERRTDISSGRSDSTQQDQATLYLPFVVISTEKKACVECKISNDKFVMKSLKRYCIVIFLLFLKI